MYKSTDLIDATLCSSCGRVLYEFLKSKGYNVLQNGTMMQENCCTDAEEQLTCDNCSIDILENDIYYVVNIEDELLAEVADIISEDIGGCEHCEGNERGYFVHKFNNDPFDRSSRIDFDDVREMNVSEYLYDQGVPEEFHELFARFIVCPCGYGRHPMHPKHNPNGGIFELHDDIYTKQGIAEFWGFDNLAFCKFAQNYGETFTVDDLLDFREFLIKYPMLAYKHPTGQAIYNVLLKHFEAKDYTILKPGHISFYRGRTRKKDSNGAYTKEQMWSPPLGEPHHGRFNTVGVPVLYVCDHLEAVPYEINPSHEDVVDIAEFELQKELKIFDIGSFDPDFQGFFCEKSGETKILKQAYLLPNYIGACCSEIGYDGVKYEGVHTQIKYTNYALFDVNKDDNVLVIKGYIKTFVPNLSYSLSLK